jgi:hypothetical protein
VAKPNSLLRSLVIAANLLMWPDNQIVLILQTIVPVGKMRLFAFGPKRTWAAALHMSAFEGKANITIALRNAWR